MSSRGAGCPVRLDIFVQSDAEPIEEEVFVVDVLVRVTRPLAQDENIATACANGFDDASFDQRVDVSGDLSGADTAKALSKFVAEYGAG